MQNKKQPNRNSAVVIYENGYPNPGGIATLVGIYPTHRAAVFISKIVKERNKLPFFPTIEATVQAPTTIFVENYLERMDENRKETVKA
jgi:hypothetical protein